MEACRIGIHLKAPGVVDVGAPMKHKDLCYEMLRDARTVMDATPDHAFQRGVTAVVIVLDMTGRVDIGAPLPPRGLAEQSLVLARDIIERYNDDAAPVLRPFSDVVMG